MRESRGILLERFAKMNAREAEREVKYRLIKVATKDQNRKR